MFIGARTTNRPTRMYRFSILFWGDVSVLIINSLCLLYVLKNFLFMFHFFFFFRNGFAIYSLP